jgi:hypothetical protein
MARKMFIGGLNWETTDRMYIVDTLQIFSDVRLRVSA